MSVRHWASVAVIALMVVVVSGATLWRGAAPTAESTAVMLDAFGTPVGTPPVTPPEQPTPAAAVETVQTAMIEVQGAVATPGVYALDADARIYNALMAAGGPHAEADLSDLNIAARLVDGSVLSVPYRAASPGDGTPGAAALNPPAYTRSGWQGVGQSSIAVGAVTAPAGGRININTATQAALEELPGVGPKTAEKIIRFREMQPFSSVEDLQYVQGIGEKRLETLRPHVTVE